MIAKKLGVANSLEQFLKRRNELAAQQQQKDWKTTENN